MPIIKPMKVGSNPSLQVTTVKLSSILLLFIVFCLVYSCNRSGENAGNAGVPARIPQDHPGFAGDQTCRSCHQAEWDQWQGSHHDYAMAAAGEETVRGDFSDVFFQDGNDLYRFFREEDKYMVEAPGPEGKQEVYEIKYTFGWEPLQQYLVDFGRGKYQALHAAWDTEREQWFSLYPDEEISPGDWLHWTGGAMNWNTMCADCHSTNLRTGYIAAADSFHTTWSAINVSCEACHGPGREHVRFMQSPEGENADSERIRRDLNLPRGSSQRAELNTCAPCHSARQALSSDYRHGDKFLDHFDPLLPHPEYYHPDGQIREEAFEYGSFLQSKMHAHEVRCTDCHDPHTLKLKETLNGNRLCLQCHEPQYNSPDHHFHPVGTEASQCISCHMPGKYYMQNDYRHDHSFRIPRPDLSALLETPNACNQCHTDRPPEWAAAAVEQWYGEQRPAHFSETFVRARESEDADAVITELRRLLEDTSQPGIARATALWHIRQSPTEQAHNIYRKALESDNPLVRAEAARALAALPARSSGPLLSDALQDELRMVRLAAFRGLAELGAADIDHADREPFGKTLREYEDYLDRNRYFPGGLLNIGDYHARRGEADQAIRAYHQALAKDSESNTARLNLAYLYNSREDNKRAEELLRAAISRDPDFGQAYYSLGLVLAEEKRLQEAAEYFGKAAERMPRQARLYYNWAIALQTLERHGEAETSYREAIRLEPENPDYRYGLITLYYQNRRYEEALEHAEILVRQHPGQPRFRQLIRMIEQGM